VDLLQPLAASQIQANLLLSEIHGFAVFGIADREAGLRYLFTAARMGDAGALRQLGLLSAYHRRWDLVRPLLEESARRGDAAAVHALAGVHAEDMGGAEEPVRNLDGRLLERALPQLAADIELPVAETLNETPIIRRLAGVIPPLVLDSVIHQAAPLVQRSMIVDARTGEMRADPMRTSSHVTLGPRQHDHVLEALERCTSRLSGIPALNGEYLQILRYRPGEEFRPHVDYFNESGDSAYQSLADGGQRVQTVLLYLNADYTGGSTFFPRLRLDIKAGRGDMLHFHNVGENGLGHKDSLHAGMPVISGEKWLLSQWIRSERYPARVAW